LWQNLETIFKIDLAATKKVHGGFVDIDLSSTAECAICYSAHTIDDPVKYGKRKRADREAALAPDIANRKVAEQSGYFISCLNSKCKKHYHKECVNSWLKSLPGVKRSFGTIFGTCPYCADVIEVSEA
jgi:hypothetical protein